MPRDTHHVVHNPDGGWDVKRGGGERSSGHFDTKKEAVDAGREISSNQGTEFLIHGQTEKSSPLTVMEMTRAHQKIQNSAGDEQDFFSPAISAISGIFLYTSKTDSRRECYANPYNI